MKRKSFLDDGRSDYNSCVHFTMSPGSEYLTGYGRATEVLLEKVLSTRSDIDTLIYPALFCYRQYMELSLKELNWECDQVLTQTKIHIRSDGTKRYERYDNSTHKLGKLWASLLDKIRTIDSTYPKQFLSNIGRTVDDFEKIDIEGQAFRYAETTEWGYSLDSTKYINFISVAESYNVTSGQFQQLSCWLGSMLDSTCINPKEERKKA